MRVPRRLVISICAVMTALAVAGCEAPRPDVTFYANRTAVDTGPSRWCTPDAATLTVACTEMPPEEVARMTVRQGGAVQINVPEDIGGTPWQVYFRYVDADGELSDGRSEVFTDGRLAYTLHPFDETDQLTYVEVQSGFILTEGEQGGVDFAATRGWLVLIEPVAA